MLLELDTDLRGLVMTLAYLAGVNLHDAQRDDATRGDLRRRCFAPPGVGFEYKRDPKWIGLCPAPDRWSSFRVLSLRTNAGDPVHADCEDLAAAYAAAAVLFYPASRVEVCIVQPQPGAMAHAFCRIDGRVFDPSVLNGMHAPPSSFYETGDVAALVLEPRVCLVPS